MKELDFDELDRAVNSLMGDVSKTKPQPKPEGDDKTLTISPTLGADDAPDFSKLTETAEKEAEEAPAPLVSAPVSPEEPATSSAPAARRGGRFMDVVHPSSDMKKVNAPAARSVSRQGLTVEPRNPVATSLSAPEESPAQPTPSEPVVEQAPQKSDWPDPLDMAGYEKEPETAVTPERAEVVPETSPAAPQEPVAPLTSPFLTDAKVEKRPLGGSTLTPEEAEEPDHTPVVDLAASEGASKDDPDAQLPAEPKVNAPLPEELQNDLVAIESGSHMLESGMEAEPATVSQPTPPAEPAKPEVTGPTSIPQQYKEEPSTSEPASGAIYDTQTYHQPLAHPEKKKSGWMWVVWIALILLIGGGIGAAVYFLGIR